MGDGTAHDFEVDRTGTANGGGEDALDLGEGLALLKGDHALNVGRARLSNFTLVGDVGALDGGEDVSDAVWLIIVVSEYPVFG